MMPAVAIKVSKRDAMRIKKFGMVWGNVVVREVPKFLNSCHDLAREDFAKNFATAGGNIAENWDPLKDSTVKIRRSLGYSGKRPIHVRSGALKRTMVSKNAPGHDWQIKRSSSRRMTGTLKLTHDSKRSRSIKVKGGAREKKNLIEELTFSSDTARRVNRPLYAYGAFGVSFTAIRNMVKLWEKFSKQMARDLDRQI